MIRIWYDYVFNLYEYATNINFFCIFTNMMAYNQKMKALEYLDILNIKTKEKLIGLCLDKHILECLDDSTNFDDDDVSEGIEGNNE